MHSYSSATQHASRPRKHWRSVLSAFASAGLVAAAATGTLNASTAYADPPPATPWSMPQPVTPRLHACSELGLTVMIECAAARTQLWLRSTNSGAVVLQTVIMAPFTAGAWRSSTTGGVCGFGRVGTASLGVHHCDRITFIDPTASKELLRDNVAATVVLAHEAGHGMQENAGIDPVAATLSGDTSRVKPLELSADCAAGVATAWLVSRRLLPESAPERGRVLMRSAGSRDAAHGTSSERAQSFEAGLIGGTTECERIAGGVDGGRNFMG